MVDAMERKMKQRVLVIDVGGSHVKARVSNRRDVRQFESGPRMTAARMVAGVHKLVGDWKYDVVSIGYPGVVIHGRIATEPYNLGRGWVGFDFRGAFGRPTRVINDAAMQAIGSYQGGSMLFLGLGTGLGSAMIVDGVVESMELAHLHYKKGRTYEEYIGVAGLELRGKKRWRKSVLDIIGRLQAALVCEYVLLGGGNAKLMKALPLHVIIGANSNAIEGGIRMWQEPSELKSLVHPVKK